MKISVVIPNYNGEKLLKKNLPRICAVLESADQKVEVIITDDASKDESLAIIQEFILSKKATLPIHVVENKRNQGFSSNVNRGVQKATGDVILLLNTDVIPEKGFISPLLVHFDDPYVFAVGCMDKSIEGDKTILRGRGLGKWEKGIFIHARGEVDRKNTLWVSCGSGMFRKSIWDKLGGLDPLYNPYYWEDIDLSYRALKSGYKLIFEPESTVIHEHDLGSIKTQKSQENITRHAYRNQFIFIWKNVTDTKLFLNHIMWMPLHFLKAIIRRDIAYVQGLLSALAKLNSVVSSRMKAKKYFNLTDKQVVLTAPISVE